MRVRLKYLMQKGVAEEIAIPEIHSLRSGTNCRRNRPKDSPYDSFYRNHARESAHSARRH